MHILAIMLFSALLVFAVGSITLMLLGNAERILMVFAGNGDIFRDRLTFLNFRGNDIVPSPDNDALSLPLAA